MYSLILFSQMVFLRCARCACCAKAHTPEKVGDKNLHSAVWNISIALCGYNFWNVFIQPNYGGQGVHTHGAIGIL